MEGNNVVDKTALRKCSASSVTNPVSPRKSSDIPILDYLQLSYI